LLRLGEAGRQRLKCASSLTSLGFEADKPSLTRHALGWEMLEACCSLRLKPKASLTSASQA